MKLPLRGGLRYVNAYLLSDMETLVDPGGDGKEAQTALERQLSRLGVEASSIKRLVITHLHRDHIGLVGFFRSASGAEVYAHEEALRGSTPHHRGERRGIVADPLGGGILFGVLGILEGGIKGLRPMIQIDRMLRDGDLIILKGSTLRVLWTPGHSREHMCLLEAERKALISGDHILPHITPHIGLRTLEGNPLGDYLASLRRLRELDVRLVLPGHGEAFTDLKGRIDEIVEHHERRLREVERALAGGEKTALGVAEKLTWKSVPWSTMPPWVKLMAAEEALAHLVYLKSLGVVDYRPRGGVPYFKMR